MHHYGTTEEDLAMVAVQNHDNSSNNPYAHLALQVHSRRRPELADALLASASLRLLPVSDGACAVIFASEEMAPQLAKQPVWVRAAQITDNYFMGDRIWAEDWDSLAMLARRIYRLAKIDNSARDRRCGALPGLYHPADPGVRGLRLLEKGEGAKLIREGPRP